MEMVKPPDNGSSATIRSYGYPTERLPRSHRQSDGWHKPVSPLRMSQSPSKPSGSLKRPWRPRFSSEHGKCRCTCLTRATLSPSDAHRRFGGDD